MRGDLSATLSNNGNGNDKLSTSSGLNWSPLRSLWTHLGFPNGPTAVLHPFSRPYGHVSVEEGKHDSVAVAEAHKLYHHIPWARHPCRNVNGNIVTSFFPPAARLQIMNESIERHLDLADLVGRRSGAFMSDFFPVENSRLK